MTESLALSPIGFSELSESELYAVDGGSVLQRVIATLEAVYIGTATILGGVSLIKTPEPTAQTRSDAAATIAAGVLSFVNIANLWRFPLPTPAAM